MLILLITLELLALAAATALARRLWRPEPGVWSRLGLASTSGGAAVIVGITAIAALSMPSVLGGIAVLLAGPLAGMLLLVLTLLRLKALKRMAMSVQARIDHSPQVRTRLEGRTWYRLLLRLSQARGPRPDKGD